MGFDKHTRITEDAVARILDEASQTSYRKGGINASIKGAAITKETVMNKIHPLEFPKVPPLPEKKTVKKLYVDADEDHVSLQYLVKKGDIKKPRNNTSMPYIVYVYEGVDTEIDGRPRLINPKYFGGLYEGTDGVKQLWYEVLEYIEGSYDVDALERVYISGDGASWIKSGAKYICKAKFRLDKYHMHKYIKTATAHLLDTADDARSESTGPNPRGIREWRRKPSIRYLPSRSLKASARPWRHPRRISLATGKEYCYRWLEKTEKPGAVRRGM